MNKIKLILSLVIVLLQFGSNSAQNCPITVSGNECEDAPILFSGSTTGTTHKWTFKDAAGGTYNSSGQKTVSYSFLVPGPATVEYETTINGQTCKSSTKLNIHPKPEIKLTRSSMREQCFEKNLFCFKDSSALDGAIGGGDIKESRYLLSDGQSFTYKYPPSNLPNEVCFSIKDQRGGAFDILIEIEDEYGCEDTVNWQGAMFIYEKIGTAFSSNKPIGCDSVKAKITNVTRLNKNLVDSIIWNWGDGIKEQAKNNTGNQAEQDLFDKLWGPNYSKWFNDQGTYNSTLILTTLKGCVDSIRVNAVATVYTSKAKIISNKDSTCMSSPEIEFTVDQVPSGVSGLLWNFGDPNSGPQNFNNKTWSPSHSFTGLGPFLVNLAFKHPICGNQSIYDTIIIIGPKSTIDVMGDRIPDWQVFQCPKDVMDTVFFRNYSTFYNNGGNPLKRERWHAKRIWDFGDEYAAKCTTESVANKNPYANCKYSLDSIPNHYFKSWDLVMLEDFTLVPMEDAVFDDKISVCKRVLVYPDSIYRVIEDTIVIVPNSTQDLTTYKQNKYTSKAIFLKEKNVTGPAERFMNHDVWVSIPSGKSITVKSLNGSKNIKSGPASIYIKKGETILLGNSNQTFSYTFTEVKKRDTLPDYFSQIRKNKGDKFRLISSYKQIPAGILNQDWIIDGDRYREIFYGRIPHSQKVSLTHTDTAHKLGCESTAIKEMIMTHASAGGYGSGLIKDAVECLGALNPNYGVTFILSDLKPGASFSQVQINYDTFSYPPNSASSWNALPALSPGGRPLNPPAPWWATAYNLSGNPPNRFSMQYAASMVGGPNACITVGIIVGNGIAKPGGNNAHRPLCSDTHYYDKFACFPWVDPSMEVANLTPQSWGGYKICKWDEVIVKPTDYNKTNTRDLKSLRWLFVNNNAGPGYWRWWSRYIDEDYYHYQDSVPGKHPDYLYNYIVRTKYAEDPYQIECSNDWANGKARIIEGPDTIFTAEYRNFNRAVDVSKIWSNIKAQLEDRGFDPYSISEKDLYKYIWNGKGVIGQPSTGAKGCIDIRGLDSLVRYYNIPDENSKILLSYRDTSIMPEETHVVNGKVTQGFKFVPEYAGYHIVGLSMTSDNGECVPFDGKPIIVGFAMFMDKFTDSIVGRNVGGSLIMAPDYRYFNIDPMNNGTWDWNYYWNADPWQNPNEYDYWKDPARYGQSGTEPPTRWDWSKEDDDPNDANTIFGNMPYGLSGMPGSSNNPWIQLGGGSNLYYMNDSGVYTFRNIAGDSSGCLDTVQRRLFITRLDVGIDVELKNTSVCNSQLVLTDNSVLHDPCNWALKNCRNSEPVKCDYIKKVRINWGDGEIETYTSKSVNVEIQKLFNHKYEEAGDYSIVYYVESDQGNYDSIIQTVKISGAIPKFNITGTTDREITICQGDRVSFNNNSTNASSLASYDWIWGDGTFLSSKDKIVSHVFENLGQNLVKLEIIDTIQLNGVTHYCRYQYPTDTPFIVDVLAKDSVRGEIDKPEVLIDEDNSFIDLSDSSLTVFKWRFYYRDINGQTYLIDTVTTSLKKYTRSFNTPGQYLVFHEADYDPNYTGGNCNNVMDTLMFFVQYPANIEDVNNEGSQKLSVYPIPTNSEITVKWLKSDIGKTFSIIDVDGKIVLEGKINMSTRIIDLRSLSNGLYYLKTNNSQTPITIIK